MRREGVACAIGVAFLLAAVRGEPPGRVDAYGDPLPEGAVGRIGSNRFDDGNWISARSLSPDGKILATASVGKTVRLWDAATGRELRNCGQVPAEIGALTFSADGRFLAGVGLLSNTERVASLWEVATGKEHRRFSVDGSIIETRLFLVDGPTVIIGYSFGKGKSGLHLRDLTTGRVLRTLPVIQEMPYVAALSSDQRLLATWGRSDSDKEDEQREASERSRTIQVWDFSSGQERCRFKVESEYIQALVFAPDGRSVTVVESRAVGLWEVSTGRLRMKFQAPDRIGRRVVFAPDGRRLVAGAGRCVHQWDLETGRRLGYRRCPWDSDVEVQYSPEDRLLAWGWFGVWDVDAREAPPRPTGRTTWASSLAFVKEGRVLTIAGYEQEYWDVATTRQLRGVTLSDVHTFSNEVRRSGWLSSSGKWVAVHFNSHVHLWNVVDGQEVCSLEESTGYEDRLLFSANDRRLAGLRNGEAAVWDVETGNRALFLTVSTGESFSWLALSPDGQHLVVSGVDSEGTPFLRLWDVDSGKVVRNFETPEIESLAFSPDGKTLAGVDTCGGINLWDVKTARKIRRLEADVLVCNSRVAVPMVFSPDGHSLGCSGEPGDDADPVVLLFDVRTGEVRRRFAGHRGWIVSLAFSPDGKLLASGGSDTTVLLWDLTATK